MQGVFKKTISIDGRYSDFVGRCEYCTKFSDLHQIDITYYKDSGQSYSEHKICNKCYNEELAEIKLYNKEREV